MHSKSLLMFAAQAAGLHLHAAAQGTQRHAGPGCSDGQRFLVSVRFSRDKPLSDFRQVLESNPTNTLVVYNENVAQHEDTSDFHPGGGNAASRPWRLNGNRAGTLAAINSGSMGIPTQFNTGGPRLQGDPVEFARLLKKAEDAVESIEAQLIADRGTKVVLWSSDAAMDLGIVIAGRFLSPTQQAELQAKVKGRMQQMAQTVGLTAVTYNQRANRADTMAELTDAQMAALLRC
jgi:hypothetical protein